MMGHNLIHAADAGNGYHGRCEYCDMPLVTDLGYNSWANTICKPIGREKEAKKQAKIDEANRAYDLAYEYLRFMGNCGSGFDKENWWYIRGDAEPSFMEVKKALRKYKFDTLSEELIKHILWCPYNKDDLITIKRNRLILKTEE